MRRIATWIFGWILPFIPAAGAAANTASHDMSTTPTSLFAARVRPMEANKDETHSLKPYAGKVLLIVNVASKCGYTKQYAGLEKLYEKYKDKGLVVIGFPCNQFGHQEPGTEKEIMEFCKANYEVTFPIYAKLDVNGPNRAPLYRFLTGPASPEPGDVKWNFEKFLIGRDGKILARFRSPVAPEDPKLIEAIEKALAAPTP